jgi:hypothetical protein
MIASNCTHVVKLAHWFLFKDLFKNNLHKHDVVMHSAEIIVQKQMSGKA